MGRIQSSVGLISGLDSQAIISQLVSVSAQPRDRLISRTQSLQNEQVAITELTALVIGIQIGASALSRTDSFRQVSATSSQPNVISAVASSDAAPGSYAFRAISTAQTAVATSNAFTSSESTLSAGDVTIRAGGFLDASARLDGLRGGAGVAGGRIEITDRTGQSRQVDLRFSSTIDDVVRAINSTEGLQVTASIEGDRLALADTSGADDSNLIVQDVDGGRTATDLGLAGINVAAGSATGEDLAFLTQSTRLSSLRDGQGVRFGSGDDFQFSLADGSVLTLDANAESEIATIGQLLDRINEIDPGKLSAAIAADGDSLEITDLTSGGNAFEISSPTGNLASDLGLDTEAVAGLVSGQRIQNSLSGPLLSSLAGGRGIGELGLIDIQNRNGVSTQVDLSSANTVQDIIRLVNESNSGVSASLNENKTGIVLRDTTGATSNDLVVSSADANSSAEKLNLDATVSTSSIDSGSLEFQFIGENTLLSDLDQGRGITSGSIRITDSSGASSAVSLSTGDLSTLGDLIDAINELGIGVTAQINDAGDGIAIIDTAGGTDTLTITDVGNGEAAKRLGIDGTASAQTIGGQLENGIVGSANVVISIDDSTTLADFVSSINEDQSLGTASLLNAGPNSIRLLFSSSTSGGIGRIRIDGGETGLAFTQSSNARDAVIAVGTTDSFGGTLIRSNTNQFSDIVGGLDLEIKGTSDSEVNVNVTESNSQLARNLQSFVDQFNRVIDRTQSLTSFNAETNEVGLLFGKSEVLRVELGLSRLINRQSFHSGEIRSIAQLGVRFNDQGKLIFDEEKLNDALSANPADVEAFFADESRGFAAKAKEITESLAGVGSSVLLGRNDAIQRQIETNNSRIEAFNLRLDRETTRLQKQFLQMEQALARLQDSQSRISQLSVPGLTI